MGDVFDATAHQGFRADEPYPNGLYDCHLDYTFPSGSFGIFTLKMTEIEAPDWYITFSDVMDDLERFGMLRCGLKKGLLVFQKWMSMCTKLIDKVLVVRVHLFWLLAASPSRSRVWPT